MALQGVMDILKKTTLEEIGISFSLADLLKDLKIEGDDVYLVIFSPSERYHQFLREKVEKALKSIGAKNVNVEFSDQSPQRQQQPPPPPPQANPFETRRNGEMHGKN
jgi:ATP-binding protein involved in chromosome partitioning